jgi:hypothetical protein
MANRTPVEIPFSQFEYLVTLQKPMLSLVGQFQSLVVPFMDSLAPWDFAFEETEFQLSSAKPRDHVVTFNRPVSAPPPQMRVAVRWSSLTVSVDRPDWSEAESISKLCGAALETLARISNVPVQSQQVTLSFHVQSKTTPRNELTGVLLTPQARELLNGAILGQGLILHRENAMILIDNSAAFANGLFVRIHRTFDSAASIAQMADILLTDEQKLWDILNLEGEL